MFNNVGKQDIFVGASFVAWLFAWFPLDHLGTSLAWTGFVTLAIPLALWLRGHAPKVGEGAAFLMLCTALFLFPVGVFTLFFFGSLSGIPNGAVFALYPFGSACGLIALAGLAHQQNALRWVGFGAACLVAALALWSWATAMGMATRRGVSGPFTTSCLFTGYDNRDRVTSVWDMRLPLVVAAENTGNGFQFHALLTVVRDDATELYYWSHSAKRFELFDGNPGFVPPLAPCPAG